MKLFNVADKMTLSATGLVLLVLVGLFAPWLAPFDFSEMGADVFSFPNKKYWFGTDSLGRDLFSRILYGARVSLLVGVISAVLSVGFGSLYGAVSAWMGGRTDRFLTKVLDVLFSIPTMVLLILVSVAFNSMDVFLDPHLKAIAGICFSLCLVSWMGTARVVRNHVLQIKTELYIEASEAIGASSVRQIFRHVLPNAMGPILVLFTFQVPYNILFESFLSFIGLGLQPPYSSWGVLASEGWRMLRVYPHFLVFPGLAIYITSLVCNIFGDALRDWMDPMSWKG